MAPERLHKVIASAGVASRRASEALIAAGRVTVDGRPARVGDQVDPMTARIEIDGRPIGGPAAAVHLALHKPAGVTSTVQDRHADQTVLQLLPTALIAESRLYPVGRLDRDSEGLILLTNDGDWAERVLHPRFGIEREYAAGLPDWLTNDQRAALDAGIDLEEGRAVFAHPIRPASAAETARLLAALAQPAPDGLAWYRVVLRQGWKRQVRRMFGAIGAPVTRLVRVRVGPVRLDDLGPGRYRRLRGIEIKALGAGRVEPVRPASGPQGRSEPVPPGGAVRRPSQPGRPRPAWPAASRGERAERPEPGQPSGRADRPKRSSAPGGPERTNRTDRPETTERLGRPEPTERAGRPPAPWHPDRTARAERARGVQPPHLPETPDGAPDAQPRHRAPKPWAGPRPARPRRPAPPR